MADKKEELEPRDKSHISIHEVRELRYWTRTLGVSSDALISAVRAVGHETERVREYLRGQPRRAS